MNPLDDPATYALDVSGMFAHIERLGHDLANSWTQSTDWTLNHGGHVTNVIVAGVGGSAGAGDYFQELSRHTSPMPVSVVRDFRLPAFASENSVVVVCSFSGETEEALDCFHDAIRKGCTCIVIS